MEKRINGKLYSTDKARLIGSWSSTDKNSNNSISEFLYRKKSCEYFLYGEGGAMTKYAKRKKQNIWTSGHEFIPLSFESARAWAKEFLDKKTYDEFFGEIAESKDKVKLCLSISTTARDRARRKASQEGLNLSSYIEKLLMEE